MIKGFLQKTFGLRDGEIHISFLMQLYIFIVITVLLIVKPTVNALFLSQLGADKLPYGYLLVAVVAVVTTYFYNKAIRRYSLLKITSISLLFFSLSFITLSVILEFSFLDEWILYVYYLGVSLFAVIATSQFWVLANMVFNPREAKRLFGFIGAGAIAGGIFGGYLTSIIASTFSNKVAILIAAILLLGCIPIIQNIWRLRIRKMNSYIKIQRKHNEDNSIESSLSIISKSKHLTYLALITGMGVIVAKLVDFQFSDFANKAIQDSDELASFFGFWFSTFNVLALSIQLFLTNRILGRLGVSSTLLILPLTIALGSLLFLTFPELWVLVIIKGIDGSFKQSINKAAIELSIMPIPLHIRNQAKSYIDVAVDSVATGISGFILIFLIRKWDLNTSYITIIVLFFVLIWIVLIYRLREAYYNSFRTNIQKTLANSTSVSETNTKESTLTNSRRILQIGSEEQILSLFDRLSSYKLNYLKLDIINLLDHPSNRVKGEAIKQLYNYREGTALPKVEALTSLEDNLLVSIALEYILNHTNINEHEFFNQYLDHENEYISNAALLCLAKETSNNETLAIKYRLLDRIGKRIEDLDTTKDDLVPQEVAQLLLTIANSGDKKYHPFIDRHLNSDSLYIAKHAIKAAGLSSNDQFVEPLLFMLSQKQARKEIVKSLRRFGPKIIETIVQLDKTENLTDNTKRFLPRIIESFKTQRAVKTLTRLMRSKDVLIRLESAKSLLKLKRKEPKLVFNKRVLRNRIILESDYYKRTLDAIATLHQIMLDDNSSAIDDESTDIQMARQSIIDILEDQLDFSIKCIFTMLSVIYDESDVEMSYSGILSDIKDTRINAIEFLDNMLQNQLKTSVLPLIEHYVVTQHEDHSSQLQMKLMTEKACLQMLIKNRGKKIKLEALFLIEQLKDPSYTSIVYPLRKHRNQEVSSYAKKILQNIKFKSS